LNWIVLAGSLAGVLLLAGAAHWLGLGGDARLDEGMARALAVEQGLEPHELVLDLANMAALARDAAGRVMLIRRHGAHFVALTVADTTEARLDHGFLTLGGTTLDLGEAAGIWAAKLRGLPA
jgi:hypothetical protein